MELHIALILIGLLVMLRWFWYYNPGRGFLATREEEKILEEEQRTCFWCRWYIFVLWVLLIYGGVALTPTT